MKKILTGAVLAFVLLIPSFSFALTLVPEPTTSDISPTSGPIGTAVSIKGGENGLLGISAVMFGEYKIEFKETSKGIVFTVPSYLQPSMPPCPSGMACAQVMPSPILVTPGIYKVKVMNASGTSNSVPFKVTAGTPLTDEKVIAETLLTDEFETECVDLKYNLRLRSRDARTNGEVSVLQNFLIDEGYLLSDKPTGFFDVDTLAAVKKFQLSVGIGSAKTPGFGRVGPKSRAKINEMTCDGVTATTEPVMSLSKTIMVPVSTVPGCTAGAIFSTTTGQKCMTAIQKSSGSLVISVSATPICTIRSFKAFPATITPGQSATLSWDTSGCNSLGLVVSNTSNTVGTGPSGSSGSVSVTPTSTTNYTFAANRENGQDDDRVWKYTTVTVSSNLPTVNAYFSPATVKVNSGDTANLIYTSSNAVSCAIVNEGDTSTLRGLPATSGSLKHGLFTVVGEIKKIITCYNPAGQSSQTATISITQ